MTWVCRVLPLAVRPIFEEYVDSHGLGDRLRFYAGDFFEDPLPTADVLVMGHILHDWDLPTKKMLVKKAFDALPVGGDAVEVWTDGLEYKLCGETLRAGSTRGVSNVMEAAAG